MSDAVERGREARAQEILTRLERDAPGAVVLWHGPDLSGSDVDVLVLEGRTHDVGRVLREAGLSPAPQEDGRVMWRSFDGDGVVIDAMPAATWPDYHPSLEGFLARCEDAGSVLPAASVADRLMIRATDLVGGRPVDHVLRKARPLLDEPGARERLAEVAAGEDSTALAELISHPERLEAAGSGPLSYRAALRVAARSPLARAALRARAGRTFGVVARPEPPPGAGPGLVVALSGMDGSGKSTAAVELVARLEEDGIPAMIAWSRLAAENELLDLIAAPVRRILRRSPGTVAQRDEPIITGEAAAPAPSAAPADPGVVERAWVVVVAALNARASRRVTRHRANGVVVVSDRWLPDALVDLDVRYGHHPAAARVLRRLTPAADLAVLLEIDPETSARRKPGDQSERALALMAVRYAELADELGYSAPGANGGGAARRIDGRGSQSEVVATIEGLVREALSRRA